MWEGRSWGLLRDVSITVRVLSPRGFARGGRIRRGEDEDTGDRKEGGVGQVSVVQMIRQNSLSNDPI